MGWLENRLSKADTLYLCRKNNFSWEVQVGTSSPEIYVAIVVNTIRLPVGFWWLKLLTNRLKLWYGSEVNFKRGFFFWGSQYMNINPWDCRNGTTRGVRLKPAVSEKTKTWNPKRKMFRDDAEINCIMEFHRIWCLSWSIFLSNTGILIILETRLAFDCSDHFKSHEDQLGNMRFRCKPKWATSINMYQLCQMYPPNMVRFQFHTIETTSWCWAPLVWSRDIPKDLALIDLGLYKLPQPTRWFWGQRMFSVRSVDSLSLFAQGWKNFQEYGGMWYNKSHESHLCLPFEPPQKTRQY